MAKFLPRKKFHKFKSKILKIENLTSDTKQITISTPEDFDFYPGQFVSLILDIGGQELRRPYSIASKPEKGRVDLCIRILPDGRATPTIGQLKENDNIDAIGPMGAFYLFEESLGKPLVFISTGTGVAPFRSIINTLLNTTFGEKIYLLTGYRYKENVLYEQEIIELTKKNSNFTYDRILSREEEKGYVQTLIDKHFIPDAHYYICGLKEMVNSVKEHLESKGIKKEHIFFEKYD